ncbi:MAG: hypothetical protein AB7O52_19510 [Planctomycetota bacterium]
MDSKAPDFGAQDSRTVGRAPDHDPVTLGKPRAETARRQPADRADATPSDDVLAAGLRFVRALDSAAPLDEPQAVDPRSAACVPMKRLALLAGRDASPSEGERDHLAECALCTGRLRAFGRPDILVAPRTVDRSARVLRRPVLWIAVAMTAAAVVVGAVLLQFMAPTPLDSPPFSASSTLAHRNADPLDANPADANRPDAGPGARDPRGFEVVLHPPGMAAPARECDQVSIRYLPSVKSGSDQRVDHFELLAEEDCVVLVLLRTWDAECACLRWRVHSWLDREGCLDPRRALASGESIELPVDVSHVPPCEQAVMVATARHIDELPLDFAEASAVVACMDGSSPDETPDADVVAMLSGAPSCFPREVRLCGEMFPVR